MIDILDDIRLRLQAGEYKNEEHIRLSLVARVVQAAGWNIWNPTEVYTEFKATETEDNTRVDVALFANNFERDTLFIECKGAGRIGDDLAKVERQLRDYNRNHSALFTIITDGQHWRFYFSLTSGEFAQKLFGKLDLLTDDLTETAAYFQTFLSRAAILNGSARHEAESYLLLSRKERAMKDVLPDAEKRVTQPPFPALPEALLELLAARGLTIRREEAVAFLAGETLPKPSRAANAVAAAAPNNERPKNPDDKPLFYLHLKRSGIKATAMRSAPNNNLVVEAGSTAALGTGESLTAKYKSIRQQLIDDNILVANESIMAFRQSYTFNNATEAAAVICGYPANGKTFWKDSSGRNLGDYQE